MWFGYTASAYLAMEAIEYACRESRKGTSETDQNVFFANGKRYFYELSRKDMADGGIAGTVYESLPDTGCRKAGSFRIDGSGNVVRGPKLFKEAAGSA
jgi:hypothetical protein